MVNIFLKEMSLAFVDRLTRRFTKKVKVNNELGARMAIENAKTGQYRGWCIDALKTATTLICSCSPTIVKEATFNLLGCDK